MAVIKKNSNYMGLPMNIARGNPIPLDKSEIWYSFEEMKAYAMNSPIAYVGQILGLVDEVNNKATAYIIKNTAGDIQEVGLAVVADEKTITTNEGKGLSLKDFGKKFYKYDKSNNSYTLQQVNDSLPWSKGLEPKVAQENGEFVLGWFEPDNTKDEIASLKESLGNIYTKEETKKIIASEITAANHLSRKIVDSILDIDVDAEDAERYIYLVATGLVYDDDKYDEYIVINNRIEKVGSWEINLDGYAKKDEIIISSVSSDFTTTDKKLELVSISPKVNLKNNEDFSNLLNKTNSNSTLLDSMNSIVQGLQSKVENQGAKITENINSISELNRVVSSHSTSLNSISAQLNSMSLSINSNTTDIAELKERLTWKDI